MPTPLPPILSWPLLGGIDESGRLPYAHDDRSIREVMLNILLTRPGERLLRPEICTSSTASNSARRRLRSSHGCFSRARIS